MAALGAAGGTALAGCGGRGSGAESTATATQDDGTATQDDGTATEGSGSDSTTTETTGTPVERVADDAMVISNPPSELGFEPGAIGGGSNNTFVLESGALLRTNGELILEDLAFSDWKYNNDEMALTITLEEDLKNTNGNAFTAEDYAALKRLNRLLAPEASQYEAIEVPSDREVTLRFKEPRNRELVKNLEVAFQRVGWRKETFQPFIERARDATTDEELQSVVGDYDDFSLSPTEFMEQDLGTSPFKLTSVTESGFELELWDEHRLSDQIEIEQINRPYAAEPSRRDQLIVNDKIDFNKKPLEGGRLEGQLPDGVENYETWQGKWLIKMHINWYNRERLRNVNFRRAMAAVINSANIAQSTQTFEITTHSGMDTATTRAMVGEERMSNYIDYKPLEDAYDLADSFLEKAGFSRENGTVVDEDGNKPPVLRFLGSGTPKWGEPVRIAAQMLQNYGFNVEFNQVTRGQRIETTGDPTNDWDLSTTSHYAGSSNFAARYFRWDTIWGWVLVRGNFNPDRRPKLEGWIEEGLSVSPDTKRPIDVEIPTEVGKQDLSGSTKTINMYNQYENLLSPSSEEEVRQTVRDMSWAWNYYLPDIDLNGAVQGFWVDNANFDWPAPETLRIPDFNSALYAIKTGQASYVYE